MKGYDAAPSFTIQEPRRDGQELTGDAYDVDDDAEDKLAGRTVTSSPGDDKPVAGPNGGPARRRDIVYRTRHTSDGTGFSAKSEVVSYKIRRDDAKKTVEIIFAKPVAGQWTVTSRDPRIEVFSTAVQPPLSADGVVRQLKGGEVKFSYIVSKQPGQSVEFVERGGLDSMSLTGSLTAQREFRCSGGDDLLSRLKRAATITSATYKTALVPDPELFCGEIIFRPSAGPETKRTIYGIAKNGDMATHELVVAKFDVKR